MRYGWVTLKGRENYLKYMYSFYISTIKLNLPRYLQINKKWTRFRSCCRSQSDRFYFFILPSYIGPPQLYLLFLIAPITQFYKVKLRKNYRFAIIKYTFSVLHQSMTSKFYFVLRSIKSTYLLHTCKGNNMISSEIWCLQEQVNFLKTRKVQLPYGLVQFVVFEKFSSAYRIKLQKKLRCCLLITYMKKHHRKSRQMKVWKHTHAICTFHLCYNFALVLYENTLIFSQSETCNFFMYMYMIISKMFG